MSNLYFQNILCSDWNSADCHCKNDRLIWKLSTSNFCTGVLDVTQETLFQVYILINALGQKGWDILLVRNWTVFATETCS